MRPCFAIAALAVVPHASAGQAIAPLDQTRSASVLIDFAPCDPLSDIDTAPGFDPFDTNRSDCKPFQR